MIIVTFQKAKDKEKKSRKQSERGEKTIPHRTAMLRMIANFSSGRLEIRRQSCHLHGAARKTNENCQLKLYMQ